MPQAPVIRSRKSKDRYYNDQIVNWTNNDLQNNTQKTTKIEQHEPHEKKLGCSGTETIPVPLVILVVLLLKPGE